MLGLKYVVAPTKRTLNDMCDRLEYQSVSVSIVAECTCVGSYTEASIMGIVYL